jgi:GNAT superfamily N-acetyltransferase
VTAPARVVAVTAEAVRPLRQQVLRPHQTVAEQVYPGDDAPGAAHFAALEGGDGAVLGVASITPEPYPGPGGGAPGDFRIRGMATAPEVRGAGLGTDLLAACLAHARDRGARRVWCNARTPARRLYERAGFAAVGEEFTLPRIGPHFLMVLDLRAA